MSAKKLPVILCAALWLCTLLIAPCRGEEGSLSLAQVYAWEDQMDVFIKGDAGGSAPACRISNLDAEITASGSLGDMGVTVRTLILIDQSASIPQSMREKVVAAVQSMVERIGSTEEYKIASFGENLHVLHEYTSDRYDLSNAAKEIAFIGQQSKIYDMLYQTMPAIGPLEDRPCYYRTVIITDGADAAESGVTAEELYLKLRENAYPIDVIAVSEAQQQTENKELAALTRISGGTYFNLHAGTDVAALPAAISPENLSWLRISVPETLLDGSTRQVDITAAGGSLDFDCKFPASGVSAPPPETSPAPAPAPAPSPALPAEAGREGTSGPPAAAIAAACGGAAAAAGVCAVLWRRKKTGDPAETSGGRIPPARGEEDGAPSQDSGPGATAILPEECAVICLRDEASGQTWEIPMEGEVLIGRRPGCRVRLEDDSVSREQCRLWGSREILAENVSRSNVTKLNGGVLSAPTALRSGDRLKCGRVTLLVEAIRLSEGGEGQPELNKKTNFINV